MGALRTFPVSTVVAGRRVIVAGNDEAAAGKLRLLARTQADVHLYAAESEGRAAAEAGRHGYPVHARPPDIGDFTGAALAFIATEDEALDREVATRARSAGVPVNVVDRPELCDVLTPAIVDRAPVTIAISTEGAAPVLAGILRTRIETLMSPGLGRLAALAGSLREQVAALLPPGAKRLSFWRAYFGGEAAAWAEAHGEAELRRHALRLLDEERGAKPKSGFVWLVGAGPGAADLLTIRAQRVLTEADVIVHGPLADAGVLDHARRDARRLDAGSIVDLAGLLANEAGAGRQVVHLVAGDPASDSYAVEIAAALRMRGIPHAMVPGLVTSTAAVTAETLAA